MQELTPSGKGSSPLDDRFDERLAIALRYTTTPTYRQRVLTRDAVLKKAQSQVMLPTQHGFDPLPTISTGDRLSEIGKTLMDGVTDVIRTCLTNDAVYCRAHHGGNRSRLAAAYVNRDMAFAEFRFAR
jgi:hypothetical protein